MTQHDGSVLRLRKLHADYDPTDRVAAMDYSSSARRPGEVVTGLLYVDPDADDLHSHLDTVADAAQPACGPAELCPGAAALDSDQRVAALTLASSRFSSRLHRASHRASHHVSRRSTPGSGFHLTRLQPAWAASCRIRHLAAVLPDQPNQSGAAAAGFHL